MFSLTQEQANILEAVRANEKVIKINAFAGTGKTTTLLAIAKEFKERAFLYLAFNKSIQKEAEAKFPKNTKVKTTHALAYQHIVIKNNYKVRNNYKAREISDMFMCDIETAKLTLLIFENFCNGASINISIDKNTANIKQLHAKKYAKELFDKMLNKEIGITHSFYLKAFQIALLNKTVAIKKYDVVLLDEAQDTNDVTLSIFYNLNATQKIVVGDKHQQIYSFRGSVNAMKKVKAKIYNLTQSFRFDNEIAKNATYFLQNFKNEKNILKGTKKEDVNIKDRVYISRTNAILIAEIAELVDNKKFFKTVREPYSIFGLCLNLLKLKNNDDLDNSYKYLAFYLQDFNEDNTENNILKFLKIKAKEIEDVELMTACKIAMKYEKDIKYYYKIAKENYNSDKECKLFLTTAHTSKGLEFDEINILDDFDITRVVAKYFATTEKVENISDDRDYLKEFREELKTGKIEQEQIDELNLYYVSITRAKVKVIDYTKLYKNIEKQDKRVINEEIADKIRDILEEER